MKTKRKMKRRARENDWNIVFIQNYELTAKDVGITQFEVEDALPGSPTANTFVGWGTWLKDDLSLGSWLIIHWGRPSPAENLPGRWNTNTPPFLIPMLPKTISHLSLSFLAPLHSDGGLFSAASSKANMGRDYHCFDGAAGDWSWKLNQLVVREMDGWFAKIWNWISTEFPKPTCSIGAEAFGADDQWEFITRHRSPLFSPRIPLFSPRRTILPSLPILPLFPILPSPPISSFTRSSGLRN